MKPKNVLKTLTSTPSSHCNVTKHVILLRGQNHPGTIGMMNGLKKHFLVISAFALLLPSKTVAQFSIIDPDSEWGKDLASGEIELNQIPLIILDWIDWASKWAGTIAVIMLVWGGIRLIASGITEDKEGAKNTIKWALTGLCVAVCAWFIVNLVQTFMTGPSLAAIGEPCKASNDCKSGYCDRNNNICIEQTK